MTFRRYAALAAMVLAAPLTAGAQSIGFELDERSNQIVLRSLAGFDRCVLDLAESPACLDALRRYASKRLNDSFQAGKRARLHYAAFTALPFFEIAFRKQATDAQCGDEDVLLAVIAGLSQPAADRASIDLARDLTLNKCWESLQEGLLEAVSEAGGEFRANACPVFKAKAVAVAACEQPAH